MNTLTFHWSAILNDGRIINQFDKDGKEHLYKEVKDNFDKLQFFSLNNYTGKMFVVDLEQGIIGYNNLLLPYIESKEIKKDIRLIFFRRRRQEIGTGDFEIKSDMTWYFLGFQYLDKFSHNQKIILKINEDGSFVIGDIE